MSSSKQFFIGNESDFKDYKSNSDKANGLSVLNLPIKNLPMNYFPFFYKNTETSIANLQKLVPLIESYTKSVQIAGSCDVNKPSSHNIDTEKLFSLLSLLEEPYQPFNKNNVTHLMTVVIILWGLIGLFVLKVISVYMRERYVYFILIAILLLLLIGVFWTIAITNTVV